MATKAERTITIVLSGDVGGTQEYEAADNDASPAATYEIPLIAGNTTVTVPSSVHTPTCVTIIKPSDNTVTITLKGVAGDTGVKLHPTDPDSISIASDLVSFVLTASAGVNVRLVFS